MTRQEKGRRGGRPEPASEKKNTQPDSSPPSDLLRALRWARWTPEEAAALARRRGHAELSRRHLEAAVRLYGRDRTACRWHAERMAELHRRGVR
jgi:hypothetical protein